MRIFFLPWFLLSFGLVVLAQPDWSVLASIGTSACGYALLWKALTFVDRRAFRYLLAMIWFTCIHAIQVGWFFHSEYTGPYVSLFVLLLALIWGFQFGLLSWLVETKQRGTVLGVAGSWVLCEWMRLYLFSGYSWNPVGIALSSTEYGRHFASLMGLFGMSFWVMLTNVLALYLMKEEGFSSLFSFSFRSWKRLGGVARSPLLWIWLCCAGVPYFYGWAHLKVHEVPSNRPVRTLSTLLIQPAFSLEAPVDGLRDWEHILHLLAPYAPLGGEAASLFEGGGSEGVESSIDLIVFPEASLPYGARRPIYPVEYVKAAFERTFGTTQALPFTKESYVDNLYWAHGIANYFRAHLMLGLEDQTYGEDGRVVHAANAAFTVTPYVSQVETYKKRVLVPLGEYVPEIFSGMRALLARYGLGGGFIPGKAAQVVTIKGVSAGPAICYEETYSQIMRENHLKGNKLIIMMANDGWYPHSRLPLVHFFHSRLRALELGIPLLRACNTGITCGIDSLGRTIDFLPYENEREAPREGALLLSLPLYHYNTLYAWGGDGLVLSCAFLAVGYLFFMRLRENKAFVINKLNLFSLRKN